MSFTMGRGRLAGAAVAAPVAVRKDSATIGTRQQLHFITGAGILLDVRDDAVTGEIDITITVAGTPPTLPADWGLVTDAPPASSFDLGSVADAATSSLDWGSL